MERKAIGKGNFVFLLATTTNSITCPTTECGEYLKKHRFLRISKYEQAQC